MKHKVMLLVVAATVLLTTAAPAWAAAPFGSFGGKVDKVGAGNGAAGLLRLHGWALDDGGVESVDVLVDGVVAGRADYGRNRPEVERRYPGFPDSSAAGFAFVLDTTRYLNGLHSVSMRVRSRTGEVVTLRPRTFEFLNLAHNLAPFGLIEFPNDGAGLFGNCDLADPARRYSVISGYALDAGIQPDDSGVGYVELLIDGAVWANTDRDCRFSHSEGGMSNCYGLRRQDVEQAYPTLVDSPNSGFRFVLDLGVLIEVFGYTPGSHLLTVRAGDHAGQVTNLARIPVTFFCDDDIGNEGSFGEIDQPLDGLLYAGVVEATGWALDWEGVVEVRISVDGSQVGTAVYGLPSPGISSFFPGYPDSLAPGWSFLLNTLELSNGRHVLEAVAVDSLGVETYLGQRGFTVANPGR